jgi:DNA repair protein RadA/Sms
MLCSRCNSELPPGMYQCPSCKAWQVEGSATPVRPKSVLLSDVEDLDVKRLVSGPWDACLGGGLVRSSVTLIGGAPGAGKSTLALQIADGLSQHGRREVLYIAAEESPSEVRSRAKRLGVKRLNRIACLEALGDPEALDDLLPVLESNTPVAVILDSLPGLLGTDLEAGVVLCKQFKAYASELDVPFIVIDHVTKAEDFAGLMALQHAVDTTVTLYPDKLGKRKMHTLKNRFGPAHIDVYFTMTEGGLIVIDSKEKPPPTP